MKMCSMGMRSSGDNERIEVSVIWLDNIETNLDNIETKLDNI